MRHWLPAIVVVLTVLAQGAVFGAYTTDTLNRMILIELHLDTDQNGTSKTLTEDHITSITADILDKRVKHLTIGDPTYDDLRDTFDLLFSSGLIGGGGITEASFNTVDVAAGQGLIRTANDHDASLRWFDFGASSSITVTSNSVAYIGVKYNSGSPVVDSRATDNWNYHNEWPLGNVVNDGSDLHVEENSQFVTNAFSHILQRFYETHPRSRDARTGGLIVGETGTRNITMTAGAIWDRVKRFAISAFDTSVSGHFDIYYHVSGAWTELEATQWPNTAYDDGTDLVTMTNNRYGTLWFYVNVQGEVYMLYGNGEYVTIALAEQASPPSTLPDSLQEQGLLVARLIFQKSAGTATSIASAFAEQFSLSTSHDRLHAIDGSSDHSSSISDQRLLRADANGLPASSGIDVADDDDVTSVQLILHDDIAQGAANGTAVHLAVGESVVFGDVLYMSTTATECMKANAQVAATQEVIGMALESKSNGQMCDVLLKGKVRKSGWSFSTGDVIYLSTSSGAITASPNSSHYYRKVGVAYRSDGIVFNAAESGFKDGG